MDEPIHPRAHRLSTADNQGLEIGGGRVRSMVEAVERRTQRVNGEERSQRMSELIESMKEVVISQTNLAERYSQTMLRYTPSDSAEILARKTREWLNKHGRTDVEEALDTARCSLDKGEITFAFGLMPIARDLYYRIEKIIAQTARHEKIEKGEKRHEEKEEEGEGMEEGIDDDLEVLSLQGHIDDIDFDEEVEEEDSLLSSFEVVDDIVDCTHYCDPSHNHHHSRIEMLTTMPDCPSIDDDLPSLAPPLPPPSAEPSLPLTELTLSGVPFNLDWKTQSYWMAVTEQWANERTRMNREEKGGQKEI